MRLSSCRVVAVMRFSDARGVVAHVAHLDVRAHELRAGLLRDDGVDLRAREVDVRGELVHGLGKALAELLYCIQLRDVPRCLAILRLECLPDKGLPSAGRAVCQGSLLLGRGRGRADRNGRSKSAGDRCSS